jgi:hypothetical protein
MIRNLLIVVFVVSVAVNSLSAVLPVLEGDAACNGCCSAARRSDPRVSPSKVRCLRECNQRGDSQQAQPPSLIKIERDDKGISTGVIVSAFTLTMQPSTRGKSPVRSVVQSTHIYLRTGTLLI